MSFTSLEFLFFVTVTLLVYYLPKVRRFQVLILVLASLLFYSWDQWRLLPLLIFTVLITFISMRGSLCGNRLLIACGIITNLFILCFFKYKFLILDPITPIYTQSNLLNFLINLPLPIGISFFVFHNISLIIDSFKQGQNREPPTVVQIFLYIIFFPQLVSGPITKANSFLPQIEAKFFQHIPWLQATELLIMGLFFKLFCANNLAQVTALMAPELAGYSSGGDQ
jgi:alginate O-acetyltransferase complex protein AlgI